MAESDTNTPYSSREISWLGMAGLARNVGYGANKVFAADLLSLLTPSQPLIGLVLGMEGFLGLILNPLAGWMSDRYTTRFGRRRLYIIFSAPLAGLLWVLFTGSHVLNLAIIFLISFYFFQQVSPTPYQAWMPDIVSPQFWGRASGLLNLWWQVGNFLAFLPIPLLWKTIHGGAFWVTAAIMVVGGLVTGFGVRERAPAAQPARAERMPRVPWLSPDLIKYFVAQLFWWLAFEAMASFFTLFMVHTLHGTVIDAALGMAIFTFSTILVALAFGRLYERFPAKPLMLVCIGAFGLIGYTGTIIRSVPLAFLLLFVAGIFWGGIQVVSYPWGSDLLRQALPRDTDASKYYGLLYGVGNLTQSVGLLVAAPVTGFMIAAQGGSYSAMFWVNVMASFLSLLACAVIRPEPRASTRPVKDLP